MDALSVSGLTNTPIVNGAQLPMVRAVALPHSKSLLEARDLAGVLLIQVLSPWQLTGESLLSSSPFLLVCHKGNIGFPTPLQLILVLSKMQAILPPSLGSLPYLEYDSKSKEHCSFSGILSQAS